MEIINVKNYASKEELKKDLYNIKNMGFIKTHRNGDTGVGKTLEDLLGIEENNLSLPDLPIAEVKATRISENSLLTLFTKSPDVRGINKKLVEKYGYYKEDTDKKQLHSTLRGDQYNTLFGNPFLRLVNKDNKIYLEHYQDGIIDDCYWSSESLLKAYNKKYSNNTILFVKAETKNINGFEYFFYNQAFLLTNFNADNLIDNITNGNIFIDLRIGINPNGKMHDHGTAFRVKKNTLEKYYDIEQII